MELFKSVPVPQEHFARNANRHLSDVYRTLVKKNADYGGASFDLGAVGVAVHLHDKVTRFKSLLQKSLSGENPNFESLEDTLRDTIGYCVIGLCILEAQKGDQEPVNWGALHQELDPRHNLTEEEFAALTFVGRLHDSKETGESPDPHYPPEERMPFGYQDDGE